jgi:hypothetical protein
MELEHAAYEERRRIFIEEELQLLARFRVPVSHRRSLSRKVILGAFGSINPG